MGDHAIEAEDALAFVRGLRLMLKSKPGFRWLDAKLQELEEQVGGLASEADLMREFLDARGLHDDYERWRRAR